MELINVVNMPIKTLDDGTIVATQDIYARYPEVESVLCREFQKGERIELTIDKFGYRVQRKWMYADGGEYESH